MILRETWIRNQWPMRRPSMMVNHPTVQPHMELERAQQHRIYLLLPPTANPLPVDSNIKIGSYPSPEQICDSQIVIWMLDDITKAIASANDNVFGPGDAGRASAARHSAFGGKGDRRNRPAAADDFLDRRRSHRGRDQPLSRRSPRFRQPGRVCNGLYDVLRFKIRLVVDAAKLPQVVKAIEVGQFITVLNVQITEVVDPAIAASNPQGGYRYGNKPVLRVELDCEELLMRTWTDEILPDDMKNGLGKATLGVPTRQQRSAIRCTVPAVSRCTVRADRWPGGPYGPPQ